MCFKFDNIEESRGWIYQQLKFNDGGTDMEDKLKIFNDLTESKRIRINCLIGIKDSKEVTGDIVGAYDIAKEIIEDQRKYIIQLQEFIRKL